MALVFLFILAIATAIFRKAYRGESFATAFLFGIIVCVIGFSGLWAFIGHFFIPDKVAIGIGWPVGSPFQKEVAFANLGIGLLGVLCIWFRGNFWTATVIMNSTFLLGAAYIHVNEIMVKGNFNPLNAGPVLYFDILIPALTIILIIIKHYREPELSGR